MSRDDDYLRRLQSEQQEFARKRDPGHLAYVRTLPCCLCGDDVSVEAHHPRTVDHPEGVVYTGLATKASDQWAVPLCGRHHRELHAMNEREFWASYGVDPYAIAMRIKSS